MPEGAVPVFPDVRFPAFAARPPWLGGDLQTLRNTILAALGRSPPDLAALPAERLSFAMPDGTGDTLAATLNRPPGADPAKPLVVLVHGLTGCEDSYYMLNSAAALLAAGHPVLRLNLRGAGPSRPTCKHHYHAGRSGDLRAVLDALPPHLAGAGVLVVGYSLGGNMLLKYLGEEGARTPVRGAVSVSAPIDLAAAQHCIMLPRNAAYHRHMLVRMRREALAPGSKLDRHDRDLVRRLRTVRDFDDRFVAPRNGFASAEDYYRQSSGRGFLPAIRVPTLVIHALDDPWIPADAYRAMDWAGNGYLRPLLPAGGGHVGFHGRGSRTAWHDLCLLAFFAALG